MRLPNCSIAVLVLASIAQAAVLQKRDLLQDLQAQAIQSLKEAESDGGPTTETCTVENASIRQDWEAMGSNERKAYIKAVQCLMSLPSKSDPVQIPGARTRYDDFVAQHINQTGTIHATGNFLSWHRYFVWGYEKALRNECGYEGHQPYWNWFKYQDNLRDSPVFDGSDTSMGSDGSFVAHNGSVGGTGKIFMPSGQGGGCIMSGPFKGVQTNLGPINPAMAGMAKVNETFAYNPRCMRRDLTTFASSTWLTNENLHNLTLGPAAQSIGAFQTELQGRFDDGFLGMHGAGHFAIGGDAGDLYSSPNDPVFFLHHAMLDYVWWIWQALHLDQARTIEGTITIGNRPPSRNATVEDLVQMNYLDMEAVPIKDLLSSLDGNPLCYVYV